MDLSGTRAADCWHVIASSLFSFTRLPHNVPWHPGTDQDQPRPTKNPARAAQCRKCPVEVPKSAAAPQATAPLGHWRPSAPPETTRSTMLATQKVLRCCEAARRKCYTCHTKRCKVVVTKLHVKQLRVKELCVGKMSQRVWRVVRDRVVCDKVVCERVVRHRVVCVFVTKLCATKYRGEGGRTQAGMRHGKTRTPRNDVGKKHCRSWIDLKCVFLNPINQVDIKWLFLSVFSGWCGVAQPNYTDKLVSHVGVCTCPLLYNPNNGSVWFYRFTLFYLFTMFVCDINHTFGMIDDIGCMVWFYIFIFNFVAFFMVGLIVRHIQSIRLIKYVEFTVSLSLSRRPKVP